MVRSAELDETWGLLSACLTGDGVRASENVLDWDPVVALAERLGLSPLLYRILKQGGYSLPDGIRTRLANAYWVALRKNLRYHNRLGEIAQTFADLGVPLVLLKGLVLAGTVYPDVGTRIVGDMDLLVKEQDVDRAGALLEGLGYLPETEHASGHSFDFVRCFHGEQGFSQLGSSGHSIDLHWQVIEYNWFRMSTRVRLAELWQRVRPVAIEGVTVHQLAPEDMLLYLCVHLAVHHCYGVVRMFVDLDRLVRFGPELDWDICIRRARAFRIRNVVYFALSFTRRLLGTPVPDDVLQQLRPSASVRWAVRRLIEPARIVLGQARFGIQSERVLQFVLVDRWRYRLLGLLRVVFPGKDWIAARYRVERPSLLVLYGALHPLRMAWLAVLALGQLLGLA